MNVWHLIKRFIAELAPILVGISIILIFVIFGISLTFFSAPQHINSAFAVGGIIVTILLIGILILIRNNVFVVDESKQVLVERLGQYYDTYTGGIHILIPFIDRLKPIKLKDFKTDQYHFYKFIDIRERLIDPPEQIVTTKDNVTISVDSIVYYRITDVKYAIYNVEDLSQSIYELMVTAMRNTIGSLKLDEVIGERDKINKNIRETINEILKETQPVEHHIIDDREPADKHVENKWGVVITNVGLQNINIPEDMQRQMEQQAIAERKARALRTEAEGARDAAIRKAEGEKQAIQMKAEAEEEAIRKIKSALEDGKNQDVLRLKYFETLNHMSDGKATKVFMPFEATQMLSTLGSLREMWDRGGESSNKRYMHDLVDVLSIVETFKKIAGELNKTENFESNKKQHKNELLRTYRHLQKWLQNKMGDIEDETHSEKLATIVTLDQNIKTQLKDRLESGDQAFYKSLTNNLQAFASQILDIMNKEKEMDDFEMLVKLQDSLQRLHGVLKPQPPSQAQTEQNPSQ